MGKITSIYPGCQSLLIKEREGGEEGKGKKKKEEIMISDHT